VARRPTIETRKWQPRIIQGGEPSQKRLRVLMASHSHPEVSNGGAEIAAFQLFRGLQDRDDCEAWFLGCDRSVGEDKPGAVLSQPYSRAEYVYATGEFDWFKFANRDKRFRSEIEKLFIELRPDVVHFHHYINFGVEIFQHLRRVLPDCRIILTLHEYLAICHHYGQMVTKEHKNLCYEESLSRCNSCFPTVTKSDFFLRKMYIERFFGLVDTFISPSQFLADRYVAWGIPREKMVVLENLMPPMATAPVVQAPANGTLRLGFFGQISVLKGMDVLFDTAELLGRDPEMAAVSIEIFGDYRGQPPEFQAAFLARLAKAGPNIRFNGPYDRRRVHGLMQSVHAVLVPSIWWENSPVVIQEALRNRRPVICSDIGGMSEKVRDGVDGFHFSAGNPMALVGLIRRMVQDPAVLTEMSARLEGVPALVSGIEDYLALYRGASQVLTQAVVLPAEDEHDNENAPAFMP
jgi:glycosyltransferase involved in cell wall biosynthesis